jgi:hypothetical protein
MRIHLLIGRFTLWARALTVAFVLAVLFGAGHAAGLKLAGTVAPAAACNPCDCPEDNRDNCQGVEFYAVYVRTSPAGVCFIEAYRVDGPNTGRPVLRVNQATLDRFPAQPGLNTLIRQNQGIALYRLGTGELQVNAGPDGNGKIYTLLFDGCPATRFTETNG